MDMIDVSLTQYSFSSVFSRCVFISSTYYPGSLVLAGAGEGEGLPRSSHRSSLKAMSGGGTPPTSLSVLGPTWLKSGPEQHA